LETGPVDDRYYIIAEKAVKALQFAKAKGKQLPPLYEAVLMKVASGSRGIAGDVGRDSGDPVVVLVATSEVANTLTVCRWDGFRSNGMPKHGLVIEGDRLRILTPREWERLMGFPDDFTLVPNHKNQLAEDSPRFTGLGNSIVVPILSWIGQRIAQGFAVDPLPGPASEAKPMRPPHRTT
jgi:site-specific DNA-cytosine methylase